MAFVLDNSVVCGWILENQATDYSAAIARRLEQERAVAPLLLRLEIVNVLRTACKRQVMIASQAQELLAQFSLLPIEIHSYSSEPGLLLALALRYDLTSYDAAYLELALRMQLPIATQDVALAEAARSAGVGVVARG
ncbi:MAG: type II toxin-antitoxin system VapC family toxin [Proteobacteria bacterium]|nr:type II toxin-antitoxin system VapC family toxin [Pseudomonadota bacterium]MCL2307022.1 type II toxin-antitoxin system VapC family toxin [Pseudomonadota bacterium]